MHIMKGIAGKNGSAFCDARPEREGLRTFSRL